MPTVLIAVKQGFLTGVLNPILPTKGVIFPKYVLKLTLIFSIKKVKWCTGGKLYFFQSARGKEYKKG